MLTSSIFDTGRSVQNDTLQAEVRNLQGQVAYWQEQALKYRLFWMDAERDLAVSRAFEAAVHTPSLN